MRSTEGQKYTASLFFGGLARDIDPEMLDPKTGAFLEAHGMRISNMVKNILTKLPGDKEFITATAVEANILTGLVWLNGYVVEFWHDTLTGYGTIRANGVVVASSLDIPGDDSHWLDIDTNSDTGELFITDNKQCPVVYELPDLLANVATQKYFTNYDRTLYEINKPVQLNQPMFVSLEDLGAAGGLRTGSYAYSMCYSTLSGEDTAWSPVSPYIPVPVENVTQRSLPISGYYSGLETYGSEPSLSPTRYGIRLRLRVVNKAGFDYIKLRRVENVTGQPPSYTPAAQFLILTVDAGGTPIDIKQNPFTIIDFVDSSAQQWAALDTSIINTLSTVKRARTIRYYDRRIILGGVEYMPKTLSSEDIFIQHSGVAKVLFPVVERLNADGFADIQNQVFKKSHRLGERYGFGLKLRDEQGNDLYTIPLKKGAEDYTNYLFPQRRDAIPASELSFSSNPLIDSTVESNSAGTKTQYSYPILIHNSNCVMTPLSQNSVSFSIPNFKSIMNIPSNASISSTFVGKCNTLSGIYEAIDNDYPFSIEGSLLDNGSSVVYTSGTDTLTFTIIYSSGDIFDESPIQILSGTATFLQLMCQYTVQSSYDYVYDPVTAIRTAKTGTPSSDVNIIEDSNNYPYNPLTPTGVGGGSGGRGNNYEGHRIEVMDTIESTNNVVGKYGVHKSTVGVSIGGLDLSKLPDYVKSFSVVRTPPAGRVVCQGIGMYALVPQNYGDTSPGLVKHLNRLWFYSPELDQVIGDKAHLFDDIANNPSNYQIQLVSPCGFFTDVYSSEYILPPIPSPPIDRYTHMDMVSMPISGADTNVADMSPMDSSDQIGVAGRITFGKWRNQSNQGSGITSSTDKYIYDITSASTAIHGKFRLPYLELALGANIYYTANVGTVAGTNSGARDFHEPWYIVNIIQTGKNIISGNIDTYNEIGHNIHISSVLGVSNGLFSQSFELLEERPEDVTGLGTSASQYRYIYVDGEPWLSGNNIPVGNINTYRADLLNNGSFTPSGGLTCYGLYQVTGRTITFPYLMPGSGTPIVPVIGTEIVVRYNPNSPIKVFLGDTVVGEASFLAVDGEGGGKGVSNYTTHFRMAAPMPQLNFTLHANYRQPYDPANTLGGTLKAIETVTSFQLGWIRQWLVMFTCESTVNLPMVYKDMFPRRNYVMRPKFFAAKLDSESINDYLERHLTYLDYNVDYPDEIYNWAYGGFHTPSGSNFDYQKNLPYKGFTKPKIGSIDLLSMMKRLHWSTETRVGFRFSRVFIPLNVYDLRNDKASQISILYDEFSEKGSNLYVITDRGVGMLLVGKKMLSDAGGNALTIRASDATFIGGEVWLSNGISCPDDYWRGKSEGIIKAPNNIKMPVLIFPTTREIIMLTNNTFMDISTNNRQVISDALKGIGSNNMFSVIDEELNAMHIHLNGYMYSFNMDINNWDFSLHNPLYVKSVYTPYLNGVNDKSVVASVVVDDLVEERSVVISSSLPARVTLSDSIPYVSFSVTPGLASSYEFVDIFIGASYKPAKIVLSLESDFSVVSEVLQAKINQYAPGLWEAKLPRLSNSKRLVGKTLYVSVVLPDDHAFVYDLKWVKIGYKDIIGG